MPFVEHDGAKIHWDEVGSGTPVLLIMGARYSSRMWFPVIEDLAAHHRLVYFDNRGAGQTTVPEGSTTTIPGMAADALAVMDAAGIDRAHVYGVSLGGGIAMEFAMRYPDRVNGLVLGCTAIKTPEMTKITPRKLFLYGRAIPRALLKLDTSYGSACPPAARARGNKVLSEDPFHPECKPLQKGALRAYTTSLEAVSKITAPTLVLHGEQDYAVPVYLGRQIHDTIPGSKYVEWPKVGHNYPVAVQAESSKAVLDFFAGVESRV